MRHIHDLALEAFSELLEKEPASHTASGQSNAVAQEERGGGDVVGGGHLDALALVGLGLAVLQFKKLAPGDGKTLAGLPVADDVLTDAKLFCELANPASGVDCVLKDLHDAAILTPE